MRNQSLIFAICFFFIGIAQAQEVTTFTLEEAIQYAEKHDLSIQDAQNDIQDADNQIVERRAIGIPQINGEVGYDYYIKVPTVQLPGPFVDLARDPVTGELPADYNPNVSFSLKHNLNLGLTLNSLIFDGSYFTGLKAARVFKEYVSQQLINVERAVENKVIDAYLPALIVDESLLILDKNMANLEKMLMETRETYKAGFIEQLDVDRLELSLANLKVTQGNLIRQRELAINMLKFTIGFPLDKPLEIADDLNSLLEEATEEDLAGAINFYNRPEYKVAEYNIRLNELNIDVFKSGYLPSVSGFASYQYGYQGDKLFSNEGFWVPTGLVGLRVNIPIFDGFEKRAKINRAKIGLAKAQNQKQNLERVITLEVANARTQYQTAQEQLKSQERNLALAEKIYETTRVKYREGVGSSLELTQAEQALYTTQQNKTQATYELLRSKKILEKALGK